MERDIEIIVSHFRNEASSLFLAIVEDLERHAEKLNRQRDENVFQQMQSRFVQELKKQLAYIAEKVIGQYKGNADINILRRELTAQIEYYISELLLKIRSM
jgi:hypothetical protein